MPREVQDRDVWAERVAKLLPAEATAAYIAINGLIVSSSATLEIRIWLWTASIVVLWISVPLLFGRFYRVTDTRQVAFSTATFPLWAISVNPTYLADLSTVDANDIQLYVSIVTVLVATVGPALLVKPSRVDPGY